MSDSGEHVPRANLDQKELLIKNWEIVQKIIKIQGDRSWKLRTGAVIVWWTVIGFAYSQKIPAILFHLVLFVVIVFAVDAVTKVTEEKFMRLSRDIEGALTAYANRDYSRSSSQEISTNSEAFRFEDLGLFVSRKRIGFWFPYLATIAVTLWTAHFVIPKQ
jgi:hypothetical protein